LEAAKSDEELLATFDGAIDTLLALKAHNLEVLLVGTAHSGTDLDTAASFVAAVGYEQYEALRDKRGKAA